MMELIQSLIECLKEETACYRHLVVIAEQKRELLVDGKVDVLQENVRLEEKQVFTLTPLIARRNDLLNQMAKMIGLKSLGLPDAVKKAPIEIVEEFKKTVMELIQSAKSLDLVNKVNEKLLNNGLAYVEFTLKAIKDGGKKKSFSLITTSEEKKSSFVNRVV